MTEATRATAREPDSPAADGGARSKTLLRGLTALELFAESPHPLTIAEFAQQLGVHRSSAYRVLRTLEDRRFVVRDARGRFALGPKMLVLSRGVAPNLHAASGPEIARLANEVGMTTFLAVLDGDQVITLHTNEPISAAAKIAREPGVHHTLRKGAPGHAIQSLLQESERRALLGTGELTPQALHARQRGFAESHEEVIPGVHGVAVPLQLPGEPPAALAIVHFTLPTDLGPLVARMQYAADSIAARYR